jgi:hypothetical protein
MSTPREGDLKMKVRNTARSSWSIPTGKKRKDGTLETLDIRPDEEVDIPADLMKSPQVVGALHVELLVPVQGSVDVSSTVLRNAPEGSVTPPAKSK